MTPYLLILVVLLGIAPGLIAHGKGRNFLLWWIYGVVLGPVALLHAIMLRSRTERYPGDYPAPAPRRRWRSNWPVALWAAASIAVAIVAVTAYGLLSPPQFDGSANSRSVAVSADRTPPRQATGSTGAAAGPDAPVARTAPPNVRVSVRRETATPREEKLATAPVTPVERLPATRAQDRVPNERTEPRTKSAPATSTATPTPAPAAARRADGTANGKSDNSKTEQVAVAPPPKIPSIAAPKPEVKGPKAGTADAAAPKPLQPPAKPIAPKPAAKPSTVEPAVAKPVPASISPAQPSPAPPKQPEKPATDTTDVTAVGETVQIVQLALAKRGYDPGPANGRAGKKTQAAIRKFQTDTGQKPTGSIDYALLEKLGIVGPRIHAFRPPPGATPGR